MRLTVGRFLAILAAIYVGTLGGALYVIDTQARQIARHQDTIRHVARELRWQEYRAEKLAARMVEYNELRYLSSVLMIKNQNIYQTARAAWKWGSHYRVSPHLIIAVAHRESAFRPCAVSSAGAVGVMQIMPRIWNLDPARLLDVDYCVQHGARILRHYLDQTGGNVGAALFAYWGGNVRRHGYHYPASVVRSKYFDAAILRKIKLGDEK